MWTAIAAGLANWIITTILVESEITRPLREWVNRRRTRLVEIPMTTDLIASFLASAPDGMPVPDRVNMESHHPLWWKVSYFLGCHLCTGTWVAFVEALALGPLIGHGWTGFILTVFVIKAIGHFTLEFTALFRRWST